MTEFRFGNQPAVTQATTKQGIRMRCPVSLGTTQDGSQMWTLPYEPVISARIRHDVVTRQIAKSKGVGYVHESFAMGCWDITITGTLISDETDENGEPTYPEEQVAKLTKLCTGRLPLLIASLVTDTIGVGRIVVTGLDLPHTEGIENQDFTITALSDEDFDLV